MGRLALPRLALISIRRAAGVLNVASMKRVVLASVFIVVSACTPRNRAAPPRSGYIEAPDATPTAKPAATPSGLPPLPGLPSLKGTIDGRPFTPRSAMRVALNTITGEATINVTEYETKCDTGAEFNDGSTSLQITVPWTTGTPDPHTSKPSVMFGVRRDGTWKLTTAPDAVVKVLSAPPGEGEYARGRIAVKAARGADTVEGEIDVQSCVR